MKLNILQCKQCGGKLKLHNDNIYQCESCLTEYLLENKELKVTQNINNNYYYSEKESISPIEKKLPLNQTSRVLILIVIFFISSLLLFIPLNLDFKGNKIKSEVQIGREIPQSPAVINFTSQVFGEKINEENKKELEKISYLDIRQGESLSSKEDYWIIEYSTLPFSLEKPPQTKKVYVPKKLELEENDITAFKKLNYLNFNNTYEVDTEYEKSALTSLSDIVAYGATFNQPLSTIYKNIQHKDKIKSLSIQLRSNDDIDLLTRFSNLEQLEITYSDEEISDYSPLYKLKKLSHLKIQNSHDISWLSGMSQLKNLALSSSMDINDYSSLYSLPALEYLSIDGGENLKELSFIQNMPKLKKLNLVGTEIQNIDVITGKKSLITLSLSNNDKLMEYSPIQTLTSLKELTLDVPYKVDTLPSFSNLSLLKKVSIDPKYRESLTGNASIEEVTLQDNIAYKIRGDLLFPDSPSIKKLTLSDFYIVNSSALSNLSSLKELIIDGTSRWLEDPTNDFFILPSGLEILTILDGDFKISPDALPFSSSLKKLEISDKGHDIPSTTKECLPYFTNIQELSLPHQKINDLTFMTNMKQLREVNLQDNYIKDVSVLTRLPHLSWVNIEQNPVMNSDLLENIIVVK